jgi:hypothetical protein
VKKQLLITLLALLMTMLATTPTFAQERAGAAPAGEAESSYNRLLQELRPLIASGEVQVSFQPSRNDFLQPFPGDEPADPAGTLTAPSEEGATGGITCFGDKACGCSDWDGGYSCKLLKWACGVAGGKYEVDSAQGSYEVGSCYL